MLIMWKLQISNLTGKLSSNWLLIPHQLVPGTDKKPEWAYQRGRKEKLCTSSTAVGRRQSAGVEFVSISKVGVEYLIHL